VKRTLKLSSSLALPVDVAGEAIAILAKRGAGKTNTATVLVEEMHAAGVQVVILDPVGAWWGIRSTADGKGEGLPFAILGGEHGDVPLEHTAGAVVADVVVDTGQSLLLDLSDFSSKAQMARFVVDFAERLFRRKARERTLVHLVLEEADSFAPQKGSSDDARMRGAIEQVVRRGRSRGLGLTMVTQRSAVLNKDVLSQADVLIAMRTTSPHDVAAIKLWISAHADDELGVVSSLPSLDTGEAWVWNPERGLLDRVGIRIRRTFDSSSTPKAGETRAEPKRLASIDLTKLGAEISATADRAKENDHAELRKRIRELERQTAATPAASSAAEKVAETVVERVEVSVFADEEREALRALAQRFADIEAAGAEGLKEINRLLDELERRAGSERKASPAAPRATVASVTPTRPPSPPTPRPTPADDDPTIGKGERTVLEVLAEYPEGRTHAELAFLAGYSAKASTLGVILSKLRKLGARGTGPADPLDGCWHRGRRRRARASHRAGAPRPVAPASAHGRGRATRPARPDRRRPERGDRRRSRRALRAHRLLADRLDDGRDPLEAPQARARRKGRAPDRAGVRRGDRLVTRRG
jgi:uncharacterized protein